MRRLVFILVILFPCTVYAASSIKFETQLHDFGVVKEGDFLDFAFDFANTGTEDLVIKRLTAT